MNDYGDGDGAGIAKASDNAAHSGAGDELRKSRPGTFKPAAPREKEGKDNKDERGAPAP